LSALGKRGRLTPDEAAAVNELIRRIPVRFLAVDVDRAVTLAFEFNIYAYDAYFLLCARTQACPLLTLDRRMHTIAGELGITTLE